MPFSNLDLTTYIPPHLPISTHFLHQLSELPQIYKQPCPSKLTPPPLLLRRWHQRHTRNIWLRRCQFWYRQTRKMALRNVVLLPQPHSLRHPRRSYGRKAKLPNLCISMCPPRRDMAVQLAWRNRYYLQSSLRHQESNHHHFTQFLQRPLGQSW